MGQKQLHGISFEERLTTYADRSGGSNACWPWGSAKTKAGYGLIYKNGRLVYAHREMLALALGRVIERDVEVAHRCDVPSCVNPAHLFEASHLENMRDSVVKERHARGSKNGHAKLTEQDVPQIDLLHLRGLSRKEIASLYGVNQATIYDVIQRRSWKHIPQPTSNQGEAQCLSKD